MGFYKDKQLVMYIFVGDDQNLSHSEPSMKVREIKGLASSSVSSLDHDTLPAYWAPGPVHLYCP